MSKNDPFSTRPSETTAPGAFDGPGVERALGDYTSALPTGDYANGAPVGGGVPVGNELPGTDAHDALAQEIKQAVGFDPLDPNVTVKVIVPEDFGSPSGRNVSKLIDQLFDADPFPPRRSPFGVSPQEAKIMEICFEVMMEVERAGKKHKPMHSPHEGASVIREEYEELWDEIKADRGKQASARAEAIQLAAMAVRYILDVNPR